MKKPQIPDDWLHHLQPVFDSETMLQLKSYLQERYKAGARIYPPQNLYFNALNLTPFKKVRVVILGQDPYHGPGQAHGLCFSVPQGIDQPPSLKNILKELSSDVGCELPGHGNLESWAKEGVLLLNTVLTVEESKPASHQGRGWELLTDKVIQSLSNEREGLIFILWGSHAQKKEEMIDKEKHLILKAPHPSPLSSYRGFFGSKPFSKANQFLIRLGQKPIQWRLP